MWPLPVVVLHIFAEHVQEMALVQHDQVVEALPAERPDDSLCHGVSVWGLHGCHDRRDPHARSALNEVLAITAVVVANEIPGLYAPGRPCDDLLPDPLCGRMRCDVDVDDPPAAMRDEDQRVYRAEREGLHREQVDRPRSRTRGSAGTCASPVTVVDGAHAGDSDARCVR